MNLNILLLPPDRYQELEKHNLHLNPATSIVVVAEDIDSKEIKAFWAAQAVIHIEPVWISNEKRDGGFLAVKMLQTLLSELASRGESHFYAFADSENVIKYLTRLGLAPLPYLIYMGVNPNLLKESK